MLNFPMKYYFKFYNGLIKNISVRILQGNELRWFCSILKLRLCYCHNNKKMYSHGLRFHACLKLNFACKCSLSVILFYSIHFFSSHHVEWGHSVGKLIFSFTIHVSIIFCKHNALMNLTVRQYPQSPIAMLTKSL